MFIKPFIANFGQAGKPKRATKATLALLYRDLQFADQALPNTLKPPQIQHYSGQASPLGHFPPVFYQQHEYFPQAIKDYIIQSPSTQYSYQATAVPGVTIHYTVFAPALGAMTPALGAMTPALGAMTPPAKQIRQMFLWLRVCQTYAKPTCARTLNIYIYPTPFTKNLPTTSGTTPLSAEHVNTAFTYPCAVNGVLLVYREEEWFKVFLHETFHAYGFDIESRHAAALKSAMTVLFPGARSEFFVSEAYTETWARIINCAIQCNQASSGLVAFYTNLEFCLQLERMFAIYQCQKVLNFMGLTYEQLCESARPTTTYKEQTHVFSYYVLTAVWLNNYSGFLQWCKQHNPRHLFVFGASVPDLLQYIKGVYMRPLTGLPANFRGCTASLRQTTRMALL